MQPYAINAMRYLSEHVVRVAVVAGLVLALAITVLTIVNTIDRSDARITTGEPVERVLPRERSGHDMGGSDGMTVAGERLPAVQDSVGPVAVTFDDLRRFYDANHQPLPADTRAPYSVSFDEQRTFYEANDQSWPGEAAPATPRPLGDPRLGPTE